MVELELDDKLLPDVGSEGKNKKVADAIRRGTFITPAETERHVVREISEVAGDMPGAKFRVLSDVYAEGYFLGKFARTFVFDQENYDLVTSNITDWTYVNYPGGRRPKPGSKQKIR